MAKFILYLTRWQLSTPVLWLVVRNLGAGLEATVLANLIGGTIFFWVDRLIFRACANVEWEALAVGPCADCQRQARVRRLVLAPAGSGGLYDRRADDHPEYRCAACSAKKLEQLRDRNLIAATVTA